MPFVVATRRTLGTLPATGTPGAVAGVPALATASAAAPSVAGGVVDVGAASWVATSSDPMDYPDGSSLATAGIIDPLDQWSGDAADFLIANGSGFQTAYVGGNNWGTWKRTWKHAAGPDHRARLRVKVDGNINSGGVAGVLARVTNGDRNIGLEFVKTTATTSIVGLEESKAVLYLRDGPLPGDDLEVGAVQLPNLAYDQVLDLTLACNGAEIVGTVTSVADGGAAVNATITHTLTGAQIAVFTGQGVGMVNLIGSSNLQQLDFDNAALSYVSHGRYLTIDHVGPLAAGTAYADMTVVTGRQFHATPGQVFEDVDFVGGVVPMASNITYRRCRFRGVSDQNAPFGTLFRPDMNNNGGWSSPYTGILVEDCEFDGELTCRQGIGQRGITVRRSIFRRLKVDTQGTRDMVFEQCWFDPEHYGFDDGDHRECVLYDDATDITLIRSMLQFQRAPGGGSLPQVSSVVSFYGTCSNITMDDNYIAGGGFFALYFSGGGEGSSNMKARRNIFGRDQFRYCGVNGILGGRGSDGAGYEWSTNRWGPRGPYFVSGDPAEAAVVS